MYAKAIKKNTFVSHLGGLFYHNPFIKYGRTTGFIQYLKVIPPITVTIDYPDN
jgi:hypothetical protein